MTVVGKIKIELGELGWVLKDVVVEKSSCTLILINGDERKEWILSDVIHCWTEAYQALTGKNFVSLL